jgi:hypothetical protein
MSRGIPLRCVTPFPAVDYRWFRDRVVPVRLERERLLAWERVRLGGRNQVPPAAIGGRPISPHLAYPHVPIHLLSEPESDDLFGVGAAVGGVDDPFGPGRGSRWGLFE